MQMGPFQPGVPVQPMVISYARNKRMDPCWVEPMGLPVHIVALRLLLQFHTHMEARACAHGAWMTLLWHVMQHMQTGPDSVCVSVVAPPFSSQVKYLPVMHPTEAEKANPPAFAARVQRAMAEALGVGITEHSFADTRLMFAARKLKLPMGDAVLEMDKVARLWGASYADCRDVLERFAAAGGACTRGRAMRVCAVVCTADWCTPHVRATLLMLARMCTFLLLPCRPACGVAGRG
jgi:hypothetical protein